MDQTVVTALISAAGVVVVAIIGVWTAHLARKSAAATATVEERAKIVEGYDKLNEDLEKRNQVLSADVSRLEARITACEEKITQDRSRIVELEYERDTNRRQYSLLRQYARSLINIIRNANLYVPEAPYEVSLHLDE